MDYSNIFNYFRDQTKKDSSFKVGAKQVENSVKKAFINVLEHSNNLLTLNFIKEFIYNDHHSEKFDYRYEVGKRLNNTTPKAFVIGIAETRDFINTTTNI